MIRREKQNSTLIYETRPHIPAGGIAYEVAVSYDGRMSHRMLTNKHRPNSIIKQRQCLTKNETHNQIIVVDLNEHELR